MREGWRETTLGEVATESSERIPLQSGIEYRTVGVLRDGKGLLDRSPFVGGETTYRKLTPIHDGQLILRSITAWEAPSAVATGRHEGAHVSGVFPVFNLNSDHILPPYMNLLCQNSAFWHEMRIRCTGTVLRRKTLSSSAFLAIPLLLPPLDEQRRIVDLIAAVDEAIEAAERVKSSTDQARRGLLGELLSEERAEREGWRATTLGESLTHSVGGIWGAEPGISERDVLVVRSTEFRNNGQLDFATAVRRSVTNRQLEVRSLAPGDVLLEKSGGSPNQPVGRVVIVMELDEPTVCSNFVHMLRSDTDQLDPRFLWVALWWRHATGLTLEYQSQTTGIRNLRTKDYLATALLLPPLEEQRRIVDLIAAVDDQASTADSLATTLVTLRSALLADLLSGDHEIPASYDALLSA